MARIEDVSVKLTAGENMTEERRTLTTICLKNAFAKQGAQYDAFQYNQFNTMKYFLTQEFPNAIYTSVVETLEHQFNVPVFITNLFITPPRFFTRDKMHLAHLLAVYERVKELDLKYKRAEVKLINDNRVVAEVMHYYYERGSNSSAFKELLMELHQQILQPLVESLPDQHTQQPLVESLPDEGTGIPLLTHHRRYPGH